LNNACQTTLIENEADIHMEAQHQHHQSGNQSSRNLEMANEFLNTTLSAIARRQKIAQMAARANWALGKEYSTILFKITKNLKVIMKKWKNIFK
jgi:hypothetical protein